MSLSEIVLRFCAAGATVLFVVAGITVLKRLRGYESLGPLSF